MFYFAEFLVEDSLAKTAEDAIRHFSSKRHTSLDLKPSSSIPGETKYFLGLEDKDQLQITRFRFRIERLMPKLIVSFRKSDQFLRYSVRLSLPSFLPFLLLVSIGLYVLVVSLSRGDEEGTIKSLIIILLIPAMTFIELFLTRRRIRQAIVNKI